MALTVAGCAESASEYAELGQPSPVFALSAANGSGELLDSGSLSGEVVILNFWRTNCVACLQEIEELKRLHREQQVRVVGIALDDNAGRVQSVMKKRGIDYEVVLGTQDVFEQFDGYAIPYTVVLDESQVVRRMVSGRVGLEELMKTLEQVRNTTKTTAAIPQRRKSRG